MAYEQKDMSGVLFKNDRKEKDSHPDYKGNAVINGKSVWISAWIKVNEDGTKRMSLAFQPKDAQEPQQTSRSAPPAPPSRQAPPRNSYATRDDGIDDRPF